MTNRFDPMFQFHGRRSGIDWRKLKAQALVESNLDPDAVSSKGAMGLAQFMPSTWVWLWRKHLALGPEFDLPNPFLPGSSIEAQAAYMTHLLRLFENHWPRALAAYNAGPTRLRRIVARFGRSWEDHLPDETAAYLSRIERELEGEPQ